MRDLLLIDIETGALPAEELAKIEPTFEAAKNLKDPQKIAEDIAQKRADWYDRAALSPITGRVLAAGFLCEMGMEIIEGDESDIINACFDRIAGAAMGSQYKIAGFNIHSFDLPFLYRRAWHLGIPVPRGTRNGRYWAQWIVDLREVWGCGEYQPSGSLDVVASFLGCGEPCDSGKDFAKLYADPATRERAFDHLRNDLFRTQKLAQKIAA